MLEREPSAAAAAARRQPVDCIGGERAVEERLSSGRPGAESFFFFSAPAYGQCRRNCSAIVRAGLSVLLLLLLPPVHTGTPVLGQQGPTVHAASPH